MLDDWTLVPRFDSEPARPRRDRARVASLAIVVIACAFARGGTADESGFGHLASIASRDAMLYVSIDDREAFTRRARVTAIAGALEEYGSDEIDELLTVFASEASMFLPPTAINLLRFAMRTGRGEISCSVEGVVADASVPEPEILAIADRRGLEPLLAIVDRFARGDEDAAEDLAELFEPMEFQLDPKVAITTDGDTRILELNLVGGFRLAIAETGSEVLVGSRVATVKRALERSRNPSFGSLKDSLRFRELWRSLAPGRGSLVAYANLRRMRQERSLALVDAEWVRGLCEDRLAGFDGIALSLRGVGTRFEAHVELERGRTSASTLDPNQTLSYPQQVAATPVLLSMIIEPSELPAVLRNALWIGGNDNAGAYLEEILDDCGGPEAFEPLTRALGGECDLFVLGDAASNDTTPRLGMRYRIKDRALLEQCLATLVKNAPRRVRVGKVEGRTFYVFSPGKKMFSADPAIYIDNEYVVGATSANHLRILIEDLKRRPRVERDPTWLQAFDRLDVAPEDPSLAHGFFDIAELAETVPMWFAPLYKVVADEPRLGPLVVEMFHAFEDPDVQESLSHIAFRAVSRPSGVRIELIGP